MLKRTERIVKTTKSIGLMAIGRSIISPMAFCICTPRSCKETTRPRAQPRIAPMKPRVPLSSKKSLAMFAGVAPKSHEHADLARLLLNQHIHDAGNAESGDDHKQ